MDGVIWFLVSGFFLAVWFAAKLRYSGGVSRSFTTVSFPQQFHERTSSMGPVHACILVATPLFPQCVPRCWSSGLWNGRSWEVSESYSLLTLSKRAGKALGVIFTQPLHIFGISVATCISMVTACSEYTKAADTTASSTEISAFHPQSSVTISLAKHISDIPPPLIPPPHTKSRSIKTSRCQLWKLLLSRWQ
jgi:hypothetical protein